MTTWTWLADPALLPAGWDATRLRFRVRVNPSARELDLAEDARVSFVPMDAIGEFGGLTLDQERAIDEVGNGYTYFADGDVIVAKITPCFENGKGALAADLTNGIAFGTTELHVLRPTNSLDSRYLFYLTISEPYRKWGEASMYGAGGQKRVPELFIKDLVVPVPPAHKQRAIATFLDQRTAKIDALIAKKERLLALLAEKRQSIITRAVTKGLDFTVLMKDTGISWLGSIPAHWSVMRLRFAMGRIEQGWSPQCHNEPATEDEWGVLKVGCVNREVFDPAQHKALPAELEPRAQYEIQTGDILMSRANTRDLLGSAALVGNVRPRLLLCDKLYRFRSGPNLLPAFAVRTLRSNVSRFQYERDATGTSGSMQNIGQDTIKNILIPLPPVVEQDKISAWISRQEQIEEHVARKVRDGVASLSAYRSALITGAVTGKIDVNRCL